MSEKETKALAAALAEWRWICKTRYNLAQRGRPRLPLWVNMNHAYLLWGLNQAS
jgi:hypothetical protein